MSYVYPSDPQSYIELCDCGHRWIGHDVDEYRGDGSETCCVEGCTQVGCPGGPGRPGRELE